MKDHLGVDAVEELGPEHLLDLVGHLLFHHLVDPFGVGVVVGDGVEAQARIALDELGADVAGHDDDRVPEVHLAPFGVGEVAVVEDLEQDVEHIGVRLLDLVEQDDAVALPADRLGELAAVVVANVARRRTDEPRDRVPLHELGHVETDQRVLAAEHKLGEGAHQFGLSDAGGSQGEEHANGPAFVLEAGPSTPDGLGHHGDGLILPDDPFFDVLFHLEQPGCLLRRQAGNRNARPHRQNLGDVFFVDGRAVFISLVSPAPLQLLQLVVQADLTVAQLGGDFVFLASDGLFLLPPHRVEDAHRLFDRQRRRRVLDANPGSGLVHEVDGLVRQEPVGDVARGQVGRGVQGLLGDIQLVMLFVPRLDAAQDFDRLLDRWLFDDDRLKTPLQRRIALDVLSILIQRRRADGLQLAAGEGRFQDVGRVDCAFGGAGAHHGVHLVDEENAVPRAFDLFDDLLQPLLELASVFRSGDQRAHVQGHQAFAQQRLRHLVADDAVGQRLDNGRLAHTGLTDQHRVVLRPSAKDLDDALDLFGPSDDRVQLAGSGGGGQVDAQLVQDRRTAGATARRLRLGHRLAEDPVRLPPDLLQGDAQALEDAGGDAFALAKEPDQQMLRADIAVIEPAGLVDGQLDDLLRSGRQADLTGYGLLAAADDELHRRPDLAQLDAKVR